MATQTERREATRGRLISAAHALFVSAGYEETSTEAILAKAKVSRGALYHHFQTKQDLFEAVFESVSAAAIAGAAARSSRGSGPGSSPLERLTVACLAWLREARDPSVATILLDQGPQVLGWARAREIENRNSLAVLNAALEQAVAAGEIAPVSTSLTAGILNAALAEAALAGMHESGGAKKTVGPKLVERTIRELIAGLPKP